MSPKENKTTNLYKASSTPRLSIVSYTPIGKHKAVLLDNALHLELNYSIKYWEKCSIIEKLNL